MAGVESNLVSRTQTKGLYIDTATHIKIDGIGPIPWTSGRIRLTAVDVRFRTVEKVP